MENRKWYLLIAGVLIPVYSLLIAGFYNYPVRTFIITFLIIKIVMIWFFFEAKEARKIALALKH